MPSVKSAGRRRLSGTVSALFLQASGPTQFPDLIGSLDLDKPALDLGAADGSGSHYALDSIRTGAVTLTRSPRGPARLLTVSDLAAFKNGRPVATLSGTLPLNLSAATAETPCWPPRPISRCRRSCKSPTCLCWPCSAPALIDPARTGGALPPLSGSGYNQTLQGQVISPMPRSA